jgi:hypothetical protein
MQSFDAAWPVNDGSLSSTVAVHGQTSVCSAISWGISTSIPRSNGALQLRMAEQRLNHPGSSSCDRSVTPSYVSL